MSVVWQPIYQGYAPPERTTVFTNNASKYGRVAVKDINISNSAWTPVQVWVWGVPSGASAADAYLIVPGWILPAASRSRGGSSRQWTGFHVLNDGDGLVVQAIPGNQAAVQIMGGHQK